MKTNDSFGKRAAAQTAISEIGDATLLAELDAVAAAVRPDVKSLSIDCHNSALARCTSRDQELSGTDHGFISSK